MNDNGIINFDSLIWERAKEKDNATHIAYIARGKYSDGVTNFARVIYLLKDAEE